MKGAKRCEEELIEVTAESFSRWAVELSKVFTDNKEQRHSAWVVLASFCAMQYIKDPQYLPGDEDSRKRKRLSPTEAKATLSVHL